MKHSDSDSDLDLDTKKVYTKLKDEVRYATDAIRRNSMNFVGLIKERQDELAVIRAKADKKAFEDEHPEVLI